jgi:pyruvate dehydrogenase E1 component alpha subunit
MLLIRNFELRAEAAYQQGKIGGFFHSYIGQEAIQTAAVAAMGKNQWWVTSYRCHALALLLGATPGELMAELYGKENGNARGRGDSMTFLPSTFWVGMELSAARFPSAQALPSLLNMPKRFFMQVMVKMSVLLFSEKEPLLEGSLHESLNLASLWDLPAIYVIENNKWGMGTGANRAICVEPIAETKAIGYNMKSYTLDGMDFLTAIWGLNISMRNA